MSCLRRLFGRCVHDWTRYEVWGDQRLYAGHWRKACLKCGADRSDDGLDIRLKGEKQMKGFDDFWGWLDDLGRAFDRLIGWVLVIAVLSCLFMAGAIAWRLANG